MTDGDVGMPEARGEHPSFHLPMDRRHRRRLGVVVILISALVVGLLWWGLSSGGGGPSGPSPRAIAAGDRIARQATNQATQAGTAMSVALADLNGLPTIANVSAAVDPYRAALLRYDKALSSLTLTSGASSWRGHVHTDIAAVVTAIGQLQAMSSAQLGTWIENFYLTTAELQSAVEELQAAVGDHGS
ncbi:MAG TPA: hypothetical protein VGG38_06285 [Acidimicrobiales bacterium]